MKKYLFIFWYILLFACNDNTKKAEQIIEIVKNKYVPDSREHIFHISVEKQEKCIIVGYTDYPVVLQAIDSLINAENLDVLNQISLLPDSSLHDKTHALVRLSVANLRSKPVIKTELISQALMGMELKLFQKKGGWYLVQTPDKYYGWMYAPALILLSDEELINWRKSKKLIVAKIYDHVYEKPDVQSQKISDVVIGALLKYVRDTTGFYKVKLSDEREAFIEKKSVQDYEKWKISRKATAENIVKTAKQFLGVPYMWGGTSSKQFDCSGFTQVVYFLNGIQLPRDASQQVRLGVEIDTVDHFAHLQPGDLLFFGKKATATNNEKVIHVAIYIGNTEFIHAAGFVKINSFDPRHKNFSAYRKGSFLRAKRIIQN